MRKFAFILVLLAIFIWFRDKITEPDDCNLPIKVKEHKDYWRVDIRYEDFYYYSPKWEHPIITCGEIDKKIFFFLSKGDNPWFAKEPTP